MTLTLIPAGLSLNPFGPERFITAVMLNMAARIPFLKAAFQKSPNKQ